MSKISIFISGIMHDAYIANSRMGWGCALGSLACAGNTVTCAG